MESAKSISENINDIETPVIRVLLIEDDPNDALLMRRMLERDDPRRFHIKHCDRLSVGIEILGSQNFDIILLDLELPDSFGMGTIEWARRHTTELPIIVLTGMEDEKFAMEALKAGAQDYLVKSKTEKADVVKSILMAMEHKKIRQEMRRTERRLELAIAAAGLGLLDWDISADRLILDDNSMGLFGLPESGDGEPIDMMLNLIHPDDLNQVTSAAQNYLLGQTLSFETEARARNKSGEWRWIHIDGKVVEYDKDGKPTRAAGVFKDITHHKSPG